MRTLEDVRRAADLAASRETLTSLIERARETPIQSAFGVSLSYSLILGVVAGPSVPGAAAQAQAWLCAALSWALFLAGLRALTWRRWREDDGEGEEGGGENVVPLRPRAQEGESKI